MTDNEIICALDRLKYGSHTYSDSVTAKNAIDLINRQKAEIERLKDHNKQLRYDRKQITIEVIKEFVKKIKEKSLIITDLFGQKRLSITKYELYKLVKETIEGSDLNEHKHVN